MRAAEFLTELFTTLYPYERTMNGGHFYDSEDRLVNVRFDDMFPNIWAVAFNRGLSFKTTGAGDQFKVFATVIAIIKEWMQQADPKVLTFSSDKDDNSRTKLYHAMVKKFLPLGYAHLRDLDLVKDPFLRDKLANLVRSYGTYNIFILIKQEELI